ncbi:MAG: hypothetical protein ABEJ83_02215, partial [Candidatus Nanohaloarchaea archaeon]
DKVHYRNHTFSDKAPGSSLLAVPVYGAYSMVEEHIPRPFNADSEEILSQEADRYVGFRPETYLTVDKPLPRLLLEFLLIFFLSGLPAALTLLLVYRLLRHEDYSKKLSAATALLLGFGTNILFYSTVFMANTLAMFFGFASFYLLRTRDWSRNKLLLAGVLGGLAGLMEYYAFIVPGILFLGILYRDRMQGITFAGGALLAATPLLIYNTLTTGSPFVPTLLVQGASKIPQTAATFVQASLKTSQLSWVIPGFLAGPIYTPLQILRILFSPSRGLFFYFPVLLFAVPGLLWMYRKDRWTGLTTASIAGAFILFNASYIAWHGGPAFGPRYLVPILPFLALPLAAGIKKAWERPKIRPVVIGAGLLSIYIAFLGFNGTSLHPTVPVGEENVTSNPVVLNPLPDYHTRFMERGPTSPWITMLAGVPDHNLNDRFHSDSDLLTIAELSSGFLVLERPFIEMGVILLVVLLLWGPSLSRYLDLPPRKTAPAAVLILGGALLLVLNTQPVFQGSGWYEDYSTGNMTRNVMSNEATLSIHSPTGGYLLLNATPAYPRNRASKLVVERDGKEFNITGLLGRRSFGIPLKRGMNELHLKAADRCFRPVNVMNNSRDLRCISFWFQNIEPVANHSKLGLPRFNGSILLRNWYAKETTNKGNTYRWSSNNATLYLPHGKDEIVKLTMKVFPFKNRSFSLAVNGETVNSTYLEKRETVNWTVPLRKGLNRLKFYSTDGCQIPARTDPGSTDTRCLSVGLMDLDVQGMKPYDSVDGNPVIFQEGWYSEELLEGDGRHRWMTTNSTFLIYPAQRENVDISGFRSYHVNRTLKIYVNGEYVGNQSVTTEESNLILPVERGINRVKLSSSPPCQRPSKVENSSDERCLSVDLRYNETSG